MTFREKVEEQIAVIMNDPSKSQEVVDAICAEHDAIVNPPEPERWVVDKKEDPA